MQLEARNWPSDPKARPILTVPDTPAPKNKITVKIVQDRELLRLKQELKKTYEQNIALIKLVAIEVKTAFLVSAYLAFK